MKVLARVESESFCCVSLGQIQDAVEQVMRPDERG